MVNNLEEIDGFQSAHEFFRFEKWIDSEVQMHTAKEVPVKVYYAGANFKERWFYFHSINEEWRLVYPDGPFHGYWGRVI